jgi:hypothetical protein
MEVRVKLEILLPTVEDGKETDLRSEMLGIRGNGSQCFGGDPEEDCSGPVSYFDRRLAAISSGTINTPWK